jgi:hypothetical protein
MVNIYNSRSWYGQNKNRQQLFIPGSNTEGLNKGNNKITLLWTILQRQSQNS